MDTRKLTGQDERPEISPRSFAVGVSERRRRLAGPCGEGLASSPGRSCKIVKWNAKACLHCVDTGNVHHTTLPGRRQVASLRRGAHVEFPFPARTAALKPEVPSAATQDDVSNPILPAPSQDPHLTYFRGKYYYCESTAAGIFLRAAEDFLAVGRAPQVRVWTPPRKGPASRNVWAPELHVIGGRCYIYFAADDGDNSNHRMFVLAAQSEDPLGRYTLVACLDTGGWAIDGTVFQDDRGAMYFVWSGWPGRVDGQQNLYLSRMSDPLNLIGPRVLLARPDQSWERKGMPICEGPQVLRRSGKTFIVYSASASWTSDYCLGMLVNLTGDLMNPASWKKVGQVFGRNEHAWGVGHCGFLDTPQGEDWIFYHAKTKRGPGWGDREVRAQPFSWDTDGTPQFGEPAPRTRLLRRRLATISSISRGAAMREKISA